MNPSSGPSSPLAAAARPACTECGSPVRWLTVSELAMEVEPGERLRVFEIMRMTGSHADSWICDRCAEWGIFDGEDSH